MPKQACLGHSIKPSVGFNPGFGMTFFVTILMTRDNLIHQSTIFLYSLIALIGGIFAASIISYHQPLWLMFLILGLVLICVFWTRQPKILLAGFCLLFFALGWWRYLSFIQPDLSADHISRLNDQIKITFTALIVAEPQIKEDKQQLVIKACDLFLPFDKGEIKRGSGKVLLIVPKYPEYQYGDSLKITGKLKTPQKFNDFDWPAYLARNQIYSVMYYPEIVFVETGRDLSLHGIDNLLYSKILSFKNRLRQIIAQNLKPPQSNLLAAIMLGDKKQLPADLIEKLNITGTRHITAISGMHIVILSQILFFVFLWLGFWRGQIFYLVVGVLILYIVMIGAPASALRAGFMIGLLFLAQKIGRLNSSGRVIVLAAAVILAFRPSLLRFDAGFQLSFAAVLGIIYIKPLIDKLFKINVSRSYYLGSLVSLSLAAQVTTLPLVIYYFGRLSLVAVLANVLIVPVLPFILGVGLVFALSGLIWSGLAKIISLPVWLLLSYTAKTIDLLSFPSFSALDVAKFSWLWLLIYYGFLLIFLRWYYRRNTPRRVPAK